MFPHQDAFQADDGKDSLAAAFRAMRLAMEQSPEWRPQPIAEPPATPRRGLRTTCAERTAIAKKAAAARWAKVRAARS